MKLSSTFQNSKAPMMKTMMRTMMSDENQTSEELTSTEGTFNTIERIYHLTLDSVFANHRQRCAK